jgi:dienelactone hydrolase
VAVAATGCGPPSELPEAKASAQNSWRDPQPEAPPPSHQPTGAQYVVRAAEDRAWAEGRGRDQSGHPEYLALTAPWVAAVLASGGSDTRIGHDPYRVGWEQARGEILDVAFPNRYGATLRGRLFAQRGTRGPLATVLFVPGRFAPGADSPFTGFANYENLLQSLAESGFLVFAVGPQGQDGSEHFVPPHPMCDPGGAWQHPQEFGLREPGACAGHEGDFAGYDGEYAAAYGAVRDATGDDRIGAGLQGQLELDAALEQRAEGYAEFETRFVFAAIDGADFLLSRANPWRDRVDEKRVALVGHSAGGHGALIAGNGDRRRRFAAVVALDSFGFPPDSVAPSTPTLIQMAERQNEFGPYDAPPPNHLWPPYRIYRRFVAEDQPAMLLALRGSTHHEWSYVPHALINPVSPLQNASSKGGQVGLYYVKAWLDYWLRSGLREDALQRLVATAFDASVDGTSIGTGTWDPVAPANAPYRIEGESVAEHLSVLFLSQMNFGAIRCPDAQAGCR